MENQIEFAKWPAFKRVIFWARHLEAVETGEVEAAAQLKYFKMLRELFEKERDDPDQPPHIHDMAQRALKHLAPDIEAHEQGMEECRDSIARARRSLEAANREADQ